MYQLFNEQLRKQLMDQGFHFLQWGKRLRSSAIGSVPAKIDSCIELIPLREKRQRCPSQYEIDSLKARMQTEMNRVQFFVRVQ